jgi:uncharacterized protein
MVVQHWSLSTEDIFMTQSNEGRQFEIQFSNGADQLAGTVELPAVAPPYPAMIFIHGSGPADRGAFPTLSRYFVSRGFAVLNYDKPGVGASQGDWLKQTFADRAHEAAAALQFLQNYPGVNGRAVGLCGGSQAGWVMPIAAQLAPDLAFIISISAAAVPPAAQERYRLEWQMRANSFAETDISAALAVYDQRLALIRQGLAAEAVAAEQSKAQNQPWYPYLVDITPEDIGFFAAVYDFDPLPFLRRLALPFLGIWGESDTVVPVEKSAALTEKALTEAGNNQFALKIFPQANHGLRIMTADGQGSDFAPNFLASMSDWLAELNLL